MFSPFRNSFLKENRAQKGFSVICVYNNREKLDKYLVRSLKKQTIPYELITLDNTTGKFCSAAPLLNETAKNARYEYLMFVHQDIALRAGTWMEKAVKDLEKLHRLGAAGVAGKIDKEILASVSHGNPPCCAGGKRLKKPLRVQTLDGCLMIVPKATFLKMPFDEAAVDGWMLYVANYCLDLIRQGYRNYVLPHEVYHESTGCEDRGALQNVMTKIIARHKDHIKTIHTTVGTWKTDPKLKTTAKAALTWPVSLSWFMIQRKILGRKLPLLASFKITYRCNLACRACPFHLRNDEDNIRMSRDTAAKALENLRQLGTRIVVFEGGEPMLWRDGSYRLHDLVLDAKKFFLRVAVTTNGTLPLDVPAHTLWVSLDGLRETHNALRSDSFDRVWSNIKDTKHPRVFIHCTLNRRNWQDIEPLAKLVKKTPTLKGMTVQFFYPYHQGEEDLALLPEERHAAIEKLLELKKMGYPILNSAGRLQAMIDNRWHCHDDILINVDPDGSITKGCYVKNRGEINCDACGFTPVAEASGALDLIPGSLYAGWRLFLK
jgi:MoaA/NifB/PqqE/SkfB family radical SAM enzyme